jgi:shikimate dehydrogenase
MSELFTQAAIVLSEQGLAIITPDLIVNTTPVGMSPKIDDSPWPEGLPLPERAIVYDLVYNPTNTLFIRQAREAGLPATNGTGMLIEQARLAFQIWTGKAIPREVMQSSIKQITAKELS